MTAGQGGGPNGRVLGYVDLGTNSIRLLVVKLVGEQGAYAVLTDQKEAVRLGDGAFGTDHLDRAAIDRTVLVASRFAALARSFGANEILAVATSATREAHNREVLLARLRGEAGLEVHVVSGEEEARLIFLGVTSELVLDDRTIFVIDIGGGSTEIILGTAAGYTHLASVKLGSIRLGDLHPPRGREGAYTRADCRALREHCSSALLRPLEQFRGKPFDLAIGTSGTIQTLASVAAQRLNGVSARNDVTGLTAEGLRAALRKLASVGTTKRRAIPGMNPARAEIIVPGAVILEILFDMLGIDALTTSTRGLKEGLLVADLSRRGPLRPHSEVSVREHSVDRLAENFRSSRVHAGQVAALAAGLFDSAEEIGLHRLPVEARELLVFAARLHDIGTAISFLNHHLHSQYILANTGLPGFDQRESAIIGLVVRLHRKKLSSATTSVFRGLADADRHLTLVLAVLLRLAEALDRTHCGLVRSAWFEDAGDAISLVLVGDGDPHREVWGAEHQAPAFRKIFERRLTVVQAAR